MRFLDTNVIIRYITGSSPAMAATSQRFLERVARGDERVFLTEVIIAEIAYVLAGPNYRVDRQGIVDRVLSLLSFSGLHVSERETVRRALEIYATHPKLDYEDASAVAHMERLGVTEIVSFDRDFDRVPGIRRVEP